MHVLHPEWTAQDIADNLEVCDAYVRATARRQNITLPRVWGGKRGTYIPAQKLSSLRGEADKRGITPSQLVHRIVGVITQEPSLADAILDDGAGT